MSKHNSDEAILAEMRTELDRFWVGRGQLVDLLDVLDVGTLRLAACRRELVNRMREEWRIMGELKDLGVRHDRPMRSPTAHPMLEEAALNFERLLDRAMEEVKREASPENADESPEA